jgi:hypothetical protein
VLLAVLVVVWETVTRSTEGSSQIEPHPTTTTGPPPPPAQQNHPHHSLWRDAKKFTSQDIVKRRYFVVSY